MKSNLYGWDTWEEFRAAQQEVVLPAGTVAHIAVTIRYIDVGKAQCGTILLMHGIPTWDTSITQLSRHSCSPDIG